MEQFEQSFQDYQRVEQALLFLEDNFKRQPSLGEIAAHTKLSEFHFQKVFSRWVGISPKRFLQFLTKEYAKSLLKQSRNLLDVTFDTGLSSPGRLHDLFVTCEAITPGELTVKSELGLSTSVSFASTSPVMGTEAVVSLPSSPSASSGLAMGASLVPLMVMVNWLLESLGSPGSLSVMV